MKKFEEKVPRLQPNTETFKILKNKDIRYENRLYTAFNIELRRVIFAK
jgi:hypothetical protein